MTWLIVFMLNHAPLYSVNKWACDTINAQPGGSGCYDWCLEHSMYQKTDGDIHDMDGRVTLHNDAKYYQRAAIGLSEDFDSKIQNACAIVMSGSEY